MLAQIGFVDTPTTRAGLGTAFTVTFNVSINVCVHEPKGNFMAITEIVVFAVNTSVERVMSPPDPNTDGPVFAAKILSYNWYITPL